MKCIPEWVKNDTANIFDRRPTPVDSERAGGEFEPANGPQKLRELVRNFKGDPRLYAH